ncbi:hypothetical protein C5167_036818 [Papaver somniferum]|uniref:OBG-type G domain-containing protein n=1 Tax=Papaver somniferum TaxID=3469 RepID=A0A4Y7I4R1_PAPSO|nr:hypothetical protein C5167_036818 [Papaver somniferum]
MAKLASHHLIPSLGFPLRRSSFCTQWRNPKGESINSFSVLIKRFSSSPKVSMSLKAGIVGLPNVGKSTLFNAVVENGKAQAANFPFCTIEPNVGIVAVPDPRLNVLSELNKSQRAVPASIEFVDIAGLVKGASQGEGLGNKFLSHIRQVDAILQVRVSLFCCCNPPGVPSGFTSLWCQVSIICSSSPSDEFFLSISFPVIGYCNENEATVSEI